MQDPPRRCSAVPFLSSFLQGRRHSASDPVPWPQQGRRSSAAKILSSSSLQVMVAVSSVSCAARNPTGPRRKSKALLLLKDCCTLEFKFKDCEGTVPCLYLFKFWLLILHYAFYCLLCWGLLICIRRWNDWMSCVFSLRIIVFKQNLSPCKTSAFTVSSFSLPIWHVEITVWRKPFLF